MNFLILAKLAIPLLPAIFDAARSVEQALPVSGAGRLKLDLVMSIVRDAVELSRDGISWDDVAPMVERVISAVVACLNASGEFKRG